MTFLCMLLHDRASRHFLGPLTVTALPFRLLLMCSYCHCSLSLTPRRCFSGSFTSGRTSTGHRQPGQAASNWLCSLDKCLPFLDTRYPDSWPPDQTSDFLPRGDAGGSRKGPRTPGPPRGKALCRGWEDLVRLVRSGIPTSGLVSRAFTAEGIPSPCWRSSSAMSLLAYRSADASGLFHDCCA